MSIDDDWRELPDPNEFCRMTEKNAMEMRSEANFRLIAEAYDHGYMAAKYGEEWYDAYFYDGDYEALYEESSDRKYNVLKYLENGGHIDRYEEETTKEEE